MPLSRKRDAARKRLERAKVAVQPVSNPNDVQPTGSPSVQPSVAEKLAAAGLRLDGNQVSVQPQSNLERVQPVQPKKRKRRDQMTEAEQGITGYDGDGNALYD